MTEGYCVKCKKKVEIKAPEKITIKSLALLQFSPGDIAIMMNDEYDFDLRVELTMQLAQKSGDLYEEYNQGRLLGEYDLRRSVMIMATQGSTPAQSSMKDYVDTNREQLEKINAL